MYVIFTKWSFIANVWLIPRNNDEQDVDDSMIPANKEALLSSNQGFIKIQGLLIIFWKLKNLCKVNSVQEVCAKCFAVHILKFEVLQMTWKNALDPYFSIFRQYNFDDLCFVYSCGLQDFKFL